MPVSFEISIVLALFMSTCLGWSAVVPSRPWYFEQVSPRTLDRETEGATDSPVPFGFFVLPSLPNSACDSVRYQQVFAASEFADLPQSGMYLYALTLRPDACANGGNAGSLIDNFVIRLSTTSGHPDGLSTAFAENVGADQTEVYKKPLVEVGSSGVCIPGFPPVPVSWDQNQYILDVPFPYSPAKGNLLIDITFSGKERFVGGARMDTQSLTNDGVSRVYGCPSSIQTAQAADTTGIAARFLFVLPQLTIQDSGPNLLLAWSRRLTSFRLEWSDSVVPSAVWRTFTGPIERFGSEISRIEIPKTAATEARYYRLFSPPTAPTPASLPQSQNLP